jgi:hypothetical protein
MAVMKHLALILAALVGMSATAGAVPSPISAVTSVGVSTGLQTTGPCGTCTLSTVSLLNLQSGTSYTVLTSDAGKTLLFNNAGAIAVSLPAASTLGFTAFFSFGIQTIGSGTVTITPVAGTINGLTSMPVPTLSGCEITSDGANWQIGPSCTAVLPGAFGGGITQLTGDVTAGPGSGSVVTTVVKVGGVTPGMAVGANTGPSGHSLVFADGANTFSASNTFSVGQTFQAALTLAAGNVGAPSINFGTTNTGIFGNSGNTFFASAGVLKGCVNGSGLAVTGGTTCSFYAVKSGGGVPLLQVHNNNNLGYNAILIDAYNTSGSVGASLDCDHSSSNTIGTQGVIGSLAPLCFLYAGGSDGANFVQATLLESDADGTVSTGVVPGKHIFKTANSAGTLVEYMRGDSRQHVSYKTGNPPVVSVCGTTPAIDANASDTNGTVTAGAGATTCAITFANGFATYNHCRVTSQSSVSGFAYSYTRFAITVTSSALAGDLIDYACDGQ